MSKITVVKVDPGVRPYAVRIEKNLESFQREVGGYIEIIYPFDREIGIICNEEGKLMELPLNRALYDKDGNAYDVIAGSFLVAGVSYDDFTDLSSEDMAWVMERFHNREEFGDITEIVNAWMNLEVISPFKEEDA